MAYFVKREIDGKPGEFEYVEVADNEIVLPDDAVNKLVVGHPKYRDVLEESIKRKENIRKLAEDLKKLEAEREEPEASTQDVQGEQQQAQNNAPTLDVDALYAQIAERLEKEAQAKLKAKTEAEANLRELAKKHGLGAGALTILANSQNPEETAAYLAKSQYRFDEVSGGAPSKPDDDALVANILKNLGLDGE